MTRTVNGVPVREVRPHVLRLVNMGATTTAIAQAAGVTHPTVANVIARKHRTCQPDIARRLLAVAPSDVFDTALPGARVPAFGARRRIEALLAIGHSHEVISDHIGGGAKSWRIQPSTRQMSRAKYEAVLRAYDELSMTPGTSEVTIRRARRSGYVPPLAWDDDQLDDPKAKPYRETKEERAHAYLGVDEIAIERVLAGESIELTQAERAIAVERLARLGLTDREIGDRIGVWAETVLRTRRRHGIESRWVA